MNISAISSSLQGLETNVATLDRAAQQIANIPGSGGDAVDIAGSLVAMMTAQIGAEASIAAIKSEAETQRSIIDMFV
jgi:hypothetical protein